MTSCHSYSLYYARSIARIRVARGMAMSLSTSQRYPANSMSKAQARQVERIRVSRLMQQ